MFGSINQRADARLKQILKMSKAKHKKTVNPETGAIEWVTTPPEIKLYGLPEKAVTKEGVVIRYKVVTGVDKTKYADLPIIENKSEVIK